MGSVGFLEKLRRTSCVSSWTDMDPQPLVQGDSGTLRLFSARVFSIVRNRDMKNFERVMEFLEATHRHFPRLVPAIKHMKILFGLKTMIIMWMLREGRGMVHIVSTIVRFFPNKLPQYEGQCSRREMFLMRKNHADFKSLAQNLAINTERLDDYMKDGMELQYGERYAQKVEDRLLDYLKELQKFLPGDGSMPKTVKNPGGEDEEDQLLLDETFSDSSAVRKPLFSEVPASRPPQSDGGEPEDGAGAAQKVEEEPMKPSSPQFCSKHQRWVENILSGCPDDDVSSSSPLLFPSSSSTSSSSQDLTPSNLVLQPSTRPPPSADPEGSVRPTLLVPVVRLVDISSFLWSSRRRVSVVLLQEGWWRSGALAPSGDQNLLDLQLPPANPVPSTACPSAPSAQERLHQNSAEPKTQNSRTFQRRPASDSSRTSQLQPRPSPPIQTDRLQPYVVLTRLSVEACLQATEGRFWAGPGADEDECSFDINALYSSDPSSSEDDDRTGCDPDYRPHVKKKRLRSEVRLF